jgi:hypothetical protein
LLVNPPLDRPIDCRWFLVMHADNGSVDHLHSRVVSSGKGVYDTAPHASPPPANEAIVAGGVWTEVDWKVAPRRSRSQDPKDAVENAAVIDPRHATRLVRQHWFDGSPFLVGEFVAHDSAPSVREFDHDLAVKLNMPSQSGALVAIRPKADLICSTLSFVEVDPEPKSRNRSARIYTLISRAR